MKMRPLVLLLKSRVKGYTTRAGTWVDTYLTKKPEKKVRPKKERRSVQPNEDDQLSLFSVLDNKAPTQPQTEPAEQYEPPTAKKPKPTKPADPASGIDYEQPWKAIEASLPIFGAQEGWTNANRKKANNEALELIEGVTSNLTGAEKKAKLRLYSGQGGVGDSMNEYYTTPAVAASMWYLLRRYGLTHGDVLEPSCGTGVFQETKPKDVTMTAVEWDETSAKINARLHPEDEIHSMAFEHFVTADEKKYDAVIGNVPFGVRGSIISFDKPNLGKAEEYFVDTALDKTKEGGMVALIVPHGIATNSTSKAFRRRVLAKAEIIGVHRMPKTAFRHSGTEAVTDILLLRKRNQEVANALGTLSDPYLRGVKAWDKAWMDGDILKDTTRGYLHGTEAVNWRGGTDVEGQMSGIPEAIATTPLAQPCEPLTMEGVAKALDGTPEVFKKAMRAANVNPYPTLATGTTRLINGELYILQGEPRRWHRASDLGEMQFDGASKEGEALGLAERLKDAAEAMRDGLPISDLDALKQHVQAYVTAYGNPSSDKSLALIAQRDPRFHPLIAAVSSDGKLSDMLEGKSIGSATDASVDYHDFDEAMGTLLGADGRAVELERITDTWLGDQSGEQDALRNLYASDKYAVSLDGEQWGLRDDLTSGDLYPKLDAHELALKALKADTPLHHQVSQQRQWLLDTIKPKTIEEIDISLRAGFIPDGALSGFITWKSSQYNGAQTTGTVTVEYKDSIYEIDGTPDKGSRYFMVDRWYDKYLNRKRMTEDEHKKTQRIEDEFHEWLGASDWREEVEEAYNRAFNSFKPKTYNDTEMSIPGWNPDRALNEYHYGALRWALEEGKGILAYDTGVGKTPSAIALVAKLQEQGKAKRPVIVVPKSLAANWQAEIEAFRPGSKVLVIGEHPWTPTSGPDKGRHLSKSDTKAQNDAKWHQVLQNQYDYILVTQPAFESVDVSPRVKGEYVNDDFWTKRGDAYKEKGDKAKQKIREQYKQSMAGKDFRERTNALYWDELGIDLLIGEEFHMAKNLFEARSRFGGTPKFLGGSGFAKRALDFNHKAKWLRDHNDDKGVFGLSATPSKNSPLEIYSLLSHIAPEVFADRGIKHSEDFIDRYCAIEKKELIGTDGEISSQSAVVGFKNMDELRSIMGRYIYRKTAEDVGLKIPQKNEITHYIDMNPEQEAMYQELRALATKSAGEKGDAHIFSIMDKMGKTALDMELLGPEYAEVASPKYDEAAANIMEGSKDGGQVVFSDSVPSHERIRARLIALGMKPEHIGVMNADAAKGSAERFALADDFITGKLKVIIGNTATMGEGVNLQKWTSDLHHLDVPWDPASVHQRNGRAIRQGNQREAVKIHTYLANKSFDEYRYQTMIGKKNWMDQLWSGGDKLENLAAQQGMDSREEFLIMMSDDPEAARKKSNENKEVQQAKYLAMKKKGASDTFRQFVKAKITHSELKDKGSKTAYMLDQRIKRLHEDLQGNEHFKHKELLDYHGPILTNTQGQAFHEGATFSIEEGAFLGNSPNPHWRVTGVDVDRRIVSLHPVGRAATYYGDNGTTDVSLEALESGITPTPHITTESEMKTLLPRLVHPLALNSYPAAIIKDHEAAIQQRLRQVMTPPDNYTVPGLKERSRLIIERGDHVFDEIYPGSEQAGTATYVLPGTPRMDRFVGASVEGEPWWAERALRDYYGHSKAYKMTSDYKKQRKAATLKKSRMAFTLNLVGPGKE